MTSSSTTRAVKATRWSSGEARTGALRPGRQIVADIDAALDRMVLGTYGYSLVSGRIPRERLEAIPRATELVEEKVGGIGRR